MTRHLFHLAKLTWLEIKIFLREPMGAIGAVLMPVVLFVVLGRTLSGGGAASRTSRFVSVDLPLFVVLFIAIGAVLSLTTIIAIYREGGILKRLKATPISPLVILSSHVLVKLALTSVTLGLTALAGRRFYAGSPPPTPIAFFLGVILASVSLLSLGFILASVIRTARFAQPIGAILLYSLLSISGLFFPLEILPRAWEIVALASPITHAVSLLRALWLGQGWTGQWIAVVVLIANLGICSAISKRVFRWE